MTSTMVETYIWRVTYQDGTSLAEYDSPDEHRSFADVDVGSVVVLELFPNAWLGVTGPSYVIGCAPERGVRPVMFRTVAINADTGEQQRWHVFGWQKNAPDGSNVKSLSYIPNDFDRAHVVMMSDQPLEVV
jgi:hypothetical protein